MKVARLKGQSLSGLMQSGGFQRHICFKLIRVNAFYTISDLKLFKMYASIDPKQSMGTSIWSHWRKKMSPMEPSGPQGRPGEPKGRSKYAKMVAREAPRCPQGRHTVFPAECAGPPRSQIRLIVEHNGSKQIELLKHASLPFGGGGFNRYAHSARPCMGSQGDYYFN